jgi:hypothetical protein
MQDGTEFPPVEVVFDGKDHFLWDGFHRYHCAMKLGRTTLSAHVTNGTKRDALWLSFSANKAHGFPRHLGVARKIIETILTDKGWSKKTLSAIARHVGVTRRYVEKVKTDLAAHGANSSHDRTGENGDSEPETDVQRAEEVEVDRGGTTYKQKSQEKKPKSKKARKEAANEPLRDAVGRVIPEHLQAVYIGQSVIKDLIRDLTCIRDCVQKHLDERDPVFSLLTVTRFQADYENLRRTLKSAMPYAVCVYCGGDGQGCKACQGLGLLNKNSYEAAPQNWPRPYRNGPADACGGKKLVWPKTVYDLCGRLLCHCGWVQPVAYSHYQQNATRCGHLRIAHEETKTSKRAKAKTRQAAGNSNSNSFAGKVLSPCGDQPSLIGTARFIPSGASMYSSPPPSLRSLSTGATRCRMELVPTGNAAFGRRAFCVSYGLDC